jgi:hypothetical protein
MWVTVPGCSSRRNTSISCSTSNTLSCSLVNPNCIVGPSQAGFEPSSRKIASCLWQPRCRNPRQVPLGNGGDCRPECQNNFERGGAMKTSWGANASYRRKRIVPRTKVRWEMLGLQDPAQSSSSPSIEDLRRQITPASSSGLSSDRLSRSGEKDVRPQSRRKAAANRKRGGASQ